MTIFTIGFTKRRAESFFELLKDNDVQLVLDIRLRNESQLAGFSKGKDLEYFLKCLINCEYVHDLTFAPTPELLDSFKKKKCDWESYVIKYQKILYERDAIQYFFSEYGNRERICLLCSEYKPDQCHRRLLAECIAKNNIGIEIIHL
jgi:uncharacterized protein (DUF488 family)